MKKLKILWGVFALCTPLFFFIACQKSNHDVPQPEISNIPPDILLCNIYDITSGSAQIKAENRFNETTEMGICWSQKSTEPTVEDFRIELKSAKKVFNVTIKYLQEETSYAVRAYVIQNKKILYSKVMVFNTLKKEVKSVLER